MGNLTRRVDLMGPRHHSLLAIIMDRQVRVSFIFNNNMATDRFPWCRPHFYVENSIISCNPTLGCVSPWKFATGRTQNRLIFQWLVQWNHGLTDVSVSPFVLIFDSPHSWPSTIMSIMTIIIIIMLHCHHWTSSWCWENCTHRPYPIILWYWGG